METNFSQLPCIYFSCKDDGTLIEVNDTLCRQLGFTGEELTGQNVSIIFTLSTRIFQQTHFFPLLKMQGHAEEIYITLQTKSKEQIPILINAKRKLVNGEGVCMHAGIVVHNRKKFEDELIAAKRTAEKALSENTALSQARKQLQQHAEELDQQIQRVNKQNEELKQFSRVVTHDLQEPLRKLSVFANLLLVEKEETQQKKGAERLIRVSEQMRSVISGLQKYVWLTETEPEKTEIDPNEILAEAERQLNEHFAPVKLIVDADIFPQIHADKEQINALFYEVLSNAVRFRKDVGAAQVKISGNSLLLNKFRNVKEKYQYTEFLQLRITDKGIGFDSENNEQVFELFKRMHSISGNGVGLSLCKKIIENHNGSITIESKTDEGTTVTIHLPMQQPDGPRP